MRSDRIVVFILDLNRSSETLQAVNSVRSRTDENIDILVHINGSNPEHADRLMQSLAGLSGVKVSRTDKNLGYAGGNNRLLQEVMQTGVAPGYFLLLNNDAHVGQGAISRLKSVLDAHPDIGAVGPRVLQSGEDGKIAADGARACPWIMQQAFRNSGKQKRDCPAPAPFEVPFIPGTCMMIRADLFLKLGGLDERFFAYFEDWDFCLRLQKTGFHCLHVPDAEVWHAGSLTTGKDSLIYHFLMTRNRYLMAHKHLPLHIFVLLFIPYFVLSRIAYKILFLLARSRLHGVKGILLALAWIMAPVAGRSKFWPIPNT